MSLTVMSSAVPPVVPTFSVIVALGAEHVLPGQPHPAVETLSLNENGGGFVRHRDGLAMPGPLPLQPCLGLVGWGKESSPRLQEAHRQMTACRPAALHPAPVILDGVPSWHAVEAIAFAGLLQQFDAQSRLAATLMQELSDGRRRLAEVEEGFAALEEFFLARNVPTVDEAFVNEPETDLELTTTALRQVLPASTRSLSAVTLHIAAAGNGNTGLSASLVCPELDEVLWRWHVPADRLDAGWVTLACPRTTGGVPKTAVLEIKAAGAGRGPRISLGPMNPLPEYRLGGIDEPRSLAMRVFVSPPRAAVAHEPASIFPIGHSQSLAAALGQAQQPREPATDGSAARRPSDAAATAPA